MQKLAIDFWFVASRENEWSDDREQTYSIAEVQADLDRGAYDSVSYSDWFRDDAIDRAQSAPDAETADAILRRAYKGHDAAGVDVKWRI